MKRNKLLYLVLLVALVLSASVNNFGQATTFKFRYESGLLFLQQPEVLSGKVVNAGIDDATVRILITQTQGTNPSILRVDTGQFVVPAATIGAAAVVMPLVDGFTFFVTQFYVTIFTDSDELIPSVSIQVPCSVPFPPPLGEKPCEDPVLSLHGDQLTKFKLR